MRVYFDTEFTGLQLPTQLISIGLVSENGQTFYAEFNDYDAKLVNDWLQENVIAHLRFQEYSSSPRLDLEHHAMKASRSMVAIALREWLAQWDKVEMWSDCLAYDWVLFCNMFGGALSIPENVFYIPFDLSTLLLINGVDPDVNREEFVSVYGNKHNALHDAKVIRACVQRLLEVQL